MTPSHELREIARTLYLARADAWSVPLGGSWWPSLGLSIADHVIVRLQALAREVEQLEAWCVREAIAPPPPVTRPTTPCLRLAWSRPDNEEAR